MKMSGCDGKTGRAGGLVRDCSALRVNLKGKEKGAAIQMLQSDGIIY